MLCPTQVLQICSASSQAVERTRAEDTPLQSKRSCMYLGDDDPPHSATGSHSQYAQLEQGLSTLPPCVVYTSGAAERHVCVPPEGGLQTTCILLSRGATAMSQPVSTEELVHSFISTKLHCSIMADSQLERILVEQKHTRLQPDPDWKLYFEPWKPSEECGG